MPKKLPKKSEHGTVNKNNTVRNENNTVSENDVIAYLRTHHDFFSRRPELLGDIVSASNRYGGQYGDNIVDLQTIFIEQLRHEQEALISTSRLNLIGQSRIHQGVLKLLEAHGLEELTEILATDLPLLLDVDVIMLCLECTPDEQPNQSFGSIRFIKTGTTDQILGKRDIRLDSDIQGNPDIFGPAHTLVRSQVLIRLNFKSVKNVGLLALGVRQKDVFSPHQGTELLTFLAAVIERLFGLWLEEKNP